MAITVQVPPPLRQHANGLATVESGGSTVGEVLTNLAKTHPALAERVLENGQVRRFVNICVNDEDVRYLDDLATPVKDGDNVDIIPAIAGGCR